MGERLVFEIKTNDETIATGYYHWSGYTEPAARLLRLLIDAYNKAKEFLPVIKDKKDWERLAIDCLQYTGASFFGNRNDGLISIDEKDIESDIEWAEHLVTIDLENEYIYNLHNIFSWECETDWDDYAYGCYSETKYDDLPELVTSLRDVFNISFDDLTQWENDIVIPVLSRVEGDYFKVNDVVIGLY